MTKNPERFAWLAVIAAPSGEQMPWTESDSPERAKRKLLKKMRGLDWAFALQNGYRLAWKKDYVAGR